MIPTSVSDTAEYRNACRAAATDSRVFERFKQESAYKQILEHCSEAQGREYLQAIQAIAPRLLDRATEFARNDTIGHPQTFEYPRIGYMAPTTLRYMKVAADLTNTFADALFDGSIIEIGGGYGGQARILHALFPLHERPFQRYIIVDLPEALQLAQKFLEQLDVKHVTYVPTQHVADLDLGEHTLFISNYALDECTPETYSAYLHRLAHKSACGYVTGGIANLPGIADLPGAKIREETPCAHPGNCIVTWGPTS